MVAINLYKLKFEEDFSMKRLFKIIRYGTYYSELMNIRGNSILWNIDNSDIIF
jgi:hypothetical protein